MIIELSAEPSVSWIWGVSLPTQASLQLIGKGVVYFLITLRDNYAWAYGTGLCWSSF